MSAKPQPAGVTRAKVKNLHRKRKLIPREISQILGISTQAVYQHLTRIEQDEQERAS